MSIAVLSLLKFVLLGALYLFLARVVRVMILEMRATREPAPVRTGVTVPTPVDDPAPVRPVRRPPRELVVHTPEGTPTVVQLAQESLLVGRSPHAVIVVDDGYASDEHASIAPDGNTWAVTDLGSTNGTFVNGAKITRVTTLHSGDQVRIGKTRIEVRR